MMTRTRGPTERGVETVPAKQKIADGYPDEVVLPTRMFSVKTCPPHYQNARTIQVTVVIPVQMMANPTTEDAGASSEQYTR